MASSYKYVHPIRTTQPQMVQLHVMNNQQAQSPQSPPAQHPKFSSVSTVSFEQGSTSNHSSSERKNKNEEDSKKPNKYITILLFLWNTFDLITDIKLGSEWFYGIETSQSEAHVICTAVANKTLKTAGFILLCLAFIGYTLYLYDALCQQCKSVKETDNITWRCAKIMKLFFEDLGSMIITIIVTIMFFRITTWTIISASVSAISFIIMFFKQAIYVPCKNGKGGDKCRACCCGLLWFLAILVLLVFTLWIYFDKKEDDTNNTNDIFRSDDEEERVMMIYDQCWGIETGRIYSNYRDTLDSGNFNCIENEEYCYATNYDVGIWCFLNYANRSRIYCGGTIVQRNSSSTLLVNNSIPYKSCRQVLDVDGVVRNVCYDFLS